MSVTIDDALLELDEHEALRRRFDRANARAVGGIALGFAIVVLFLAIVLATRGAVASAGLALANVVACVLLWLRRRSPGFLRRVRGFAPAFLLGQYLLLAAYDGGVAEEFQAWAYTLPWLVLMLRTEAVEQMLVLGGMLGITAAAPAVAVGVGLAPAHAQAGVGEVLIGSALVDAVVLALGLAITRRARRGFLAAWRAEVARNRDRLRMKRELEQARAIQLSMLPSEGPASDWLDIASLSLPATEVGGDYFDFFPLSGGRLAIVVGDVAGHGVASGLVLSGVRSALTALEDELADPSAALERLNRTLRRTAPRRLLVSLAVTLLEPRPPRAIAACAASPPPLHFAARDGVVREVTAGSLPLGTAITDRIAEVVVPLAAGDVLLLATDGVAETARADGTPFGYDRLAAAFASACRDGGAAAIRDAVLRELWAFKGEAEQVDDVTMVVARVSPR